MAKQRLEIIISAIDQASKELKELENELKGVGKAGDESSKKTKSFGQQLNGMKMQALAVAGTVAAVGIAMKKAFDLGKEGAQLEFTKQKFDNLTKSIGTVSDALMKDLRVATSGLVSDSELMGSATDFMSLGLANTHDEVVRLTSVAGKLGMDMNQLTLTLMNETTMRFDSIGVSVDGFDERLKGLKDTGMDTSAAFKEAFLQQAEKQIETVGDVSDSAMSSFMRMDKAATNLSDTLKLYMSPASKGAANIIANSLEAWEGAINVALVLDEALQQHIITDKEFFRIQGAVKHGLMTTAEAMEFLIEKEIEHDATMVEGNHNLKITANNNLVLAGTINRATGSTLIATKNAGDYRRALLELRKAQDSAGDNVYNAALQRVNESLKSSAASGRELMLALKDTSAANLAALTMDFLAGRIDNLDVASEDYKADLKLLTDEWEEAGIKGGLLDAKSRGLAAATEELRDRVESTLIPYGSMVEAQEALRLKILAGTDPMIAIQEVTKEFGNITLPGVSQSMEHLSNIDLPLVRQKMGEFTDDELEAIKEGAKEAAAMIGNVGGQLGSVSGALDDIDGKSAHVYIYVHEIGGGSVGDIGGVNRDFFAERAKGSTGGTATSRDTGLREEGAVGLSFNVPAGFQGDSFRFGANTGERVTIQTKDQQQFGGGGGGAGFTFVYSPAVSMGNPSEVERVIAPAIENVYRKLVREDGVRMN